MPMIRVTCPNCQTKFNAKDKLAGQSRDCPRCGQTLHIPASPTPVANSAEETVTVDEAVAGQDVHDVTQPLPPIKAPDRLSRQNRYLICSRTTLVAVWENETAGWQLKTNAGYIPAIRNADKLPAQGEFVLVELKMHSEGSTTRLAGIAAFALADRWALTVLEQGHDRILGKVVAVGCLNRDQKGLVRQYLRDRFMHQVWGESHEVLEYLDNADFHSSGVG